MQKSFLFLCLFLIIFQNGFAQNSGNYSINILTQKKGISLRGLSIPNENTIWASGSKGSIAISTDGGARFNWKQIVGYETRDFRAIYAWNANEAIAVAIAAPAIVLKTKDGGVSWYKVYENKDTLMFLDAIKFKDSVQGSIVGDPMGNQIFLLNTNDKGEHWQEVTANHFTSKLKDGEAFFASSNSNIAYANGSEFLITGGLSSRLWIDGNAIDLPIVQGEKTTGANSIAISPSSNNMIIVGGDFTKKNNAENNITGFKYKSKWSIKKKIGNPHGYKSSVSFITNNFVIVCGTSGVDFSKNKGKKWELISTESFHVVQKQPNKKAAILAGSDGRIGSIHFD